MMSFTSCCKATVESVNEKVIKPLDDFLELDVDKMVHSIVKRLIPLDWNMDDHKKWQEFWGSFKTFIGDVNNKAASLELIKETLKLVPSDKLSEFESQFKNIVQTSLAGYEHVKLTVEEWLEVRNTFLKESLVEIINKLSGDNLIVNPQNMILSNILEIANNFDFKKIIDSFIKDATPKQELKV